MIVAALVAAAFLAPGAMAAEHTDSEMTILEPRKDAVLKVDKFILKAVITADQKPHSLHLLIKNDSNPVSIKLDEEAIKGTAPKFHVGAVIEGALAMGTNTLFLTAEDSSGNGVIEASVSVNRVWGPLSVYKLILGVALYLFLPLTAVTYYIFRRKRRQAEVDRIFYILKFDDESKKAYEYESGGKGESLDKGEYWHFFWAVVYLSVVSFIGLALLFFSAEIALPASEFPQVKLGNAYFPEKGSRLVCGMAFLGAYLWGVQYIYRRYLLNDIIPGVYYGISTRMILAAIIALVTYNGYEALAGGPGSGTSEGGIMWSIWPALALAIGMFPQRGLRWLMDRLPIFSPENDPSVREAPLEMIEGVTILDRMRLEEQGIDTCYDLAKADFVPLILKTPYSARELVDWILQAKLCAYFGEAVKDLRQHSIKTAYDLTQVSDIEKLAPAIALTQSALEQAQRSFKEDTEIQRLRDVANLLGKFSPLSEGEKESS